MLVSPVLYIRPSQAMHRSDSPPDHAHMVMVLLGCCSSRLLCLQPSGIATKNTLVSELKTLRAIVSRRPCKLNDFFFQIANERVVVVIKEIWVIQLTKVMMKRFAYFENTVGKFCVLHSLDFLSTGFTFLHDKMESIPFDNHCKRLITFNFRSFFECS